MHGLRHHDSEEKSESGELLIAKNNPTCSTSLQTLAISVLSSFALGNKTYLILLLQVCFCSASGCLKTLGVCLSCVFISLVVIEKSGHGLLFAAERDGVCFSEASDSDQNCRQMNIRSHHNNPSRSHDLRM